MPHDLLVPCRGTVTGVSWSVARSHRRRVRAVSAVGAMMLLFGCGPSIPREYVRMSVPGATLSTLVKNPAMYRDQVIMLGGAIAEQVEADGQLWLRIRNRPLDEDYAPHRPVDPNSSEGGYYWVRASKDQLPADYRQWGRLTVVGRVTGEQRFQTEPVLLFLYARGWGTSAKSRSMWQRTSAPNVTPSVPAGLGGEFGGSAP